MEPASETCIDVSYSAKLPQELPWPKHGSHLLICRCQCSADVSGQRVTRRIYHHKRHSKYELLQSICCCDRLSVDRCCRCSQHIQARPGNAQLFFCRSSCKVSGSACIVSPVLICVCITTSELYPTWLVHVCASMNVFSKPLFCTDDPHLETCFKRANLAANKVI